MTADQWAGWLVPALFVFGFFGIFAALSHGEQDYGWARFFAVIALTSVLWPVYLVGLIAYALTGLLGLALGMREHPVKPVIESMRRWLP